jgi:hypothetical protein
MPGVVFVEEPSHEIVGAENFYDVFNALKKYCDSRNVRVIFYNYFNDQRSAVIQYLMGSTTMKYFQSGLEFNAWEWRSKDQQDLIRINNYLMAEKFYNYIRDSLVDARYFNELSNVALFKPSYASNTLNEWGWHTKTAVDGLRTSYWLSRGHLSLSELDDVDHKEWYLIDLLEEYRLERITISPAYDVEYIDLPPDFEIKTSKDSVNWNTVLAVGNNPRKGERVSHFNFEPVEARYVKLEASALRQNRYYGGKLFYRLSFAEIEVLGRKK